MKALVTGAAGFVGSTLASRLLSDDWDVVGVDNLTPYYSVWEKFSNIRALEQSDKFEFEHADLRYADYNRLLADVDVVFHQAAQPGVRASWVDFEEYVERNITATYSLLEACRKQPRIRRIVYASSSSVYGDAARYPTTEFSPTRPRSPYGVTKLAAEDLMTAYAAAWNLPTISLRYFTVYGPKQRPDMAIRRLCESTINGAQFDLYGDGSYIRDFTFVDDVVEANCLAAVSDAPYGEVFNVCGGSEVSVRELISAIEDAAGSKANINVRPVQQGDVHRTGGSRDKAEHILGWTPKINLGSGIAMTVEWLRSSGTVAKGHDLRG